MKHSEGKWSVETDSIGQMVVSAKGECIAMLGLQLEGENKTPTEANAQRIVACVNACEGVDLLVLKSIANSPKDKKIERLVTNNVAIKWHEMQSRFAKATNLLEIAINERDKERAVKREAIGYLRVYIDMIPDEQVSKFITKAEEGSDK